MAFRPENCVGVERGNKSVKIASTRARQEGADNFPLSGGIRLGTRGDPVPHAVWEDAAQHDDEQGLAARIHGIAMVNVWNRLNFPTGQSQATRRSPAEARNWVEGALNRALTPGGEVVVTAGGG